MTDGEGESVAFRYGPEVDFQSSVLATGVESVVMCFEAGFTSRREDLPIEFRTLRRKLPSLSSEIDAAEG